MYRPDAPLHGLTVVERTHTVAGAYAARLLAVLGADTVVVEPPEGHRLREQLPLVAAGLSSIFAYLSAGKRSVVLDLREPAGRERLNGLVADADIYVDDFPTPDRESSGVAPTVLRSHHPDVVYVSVRPFGMSGPKSDWVGEEVTLFHAAGEGYLLPNGLAYETHPDRPPLKIFGHFAEMQGGIAAALGALASVASGCGQVVDVAIQDAVVALTAFGIQRLGDGSVEHRGQRSFRYGGVLECADGFVELLTLEERQWRGLVELLGDPEWAKDPALADSLGRGQRGQEINERLRAWARTQQTADLVAAAQALGVPTAKYATPCDVLRDPHEVARGLFQQVTVADVGNAPVLTAPFRFDRQPLQLAGGPPELAPPRAESDSLATSGRVAL